MPPSKSLLKTSRLLHLYLGVFTTPALIFFAFTGFLQTFSFHETTKGSNYKPPQIFVELGQLHKKQTLVVPVRKPQPPATTPNVVLGQTGPGETEGRKAHGAEGDGAAKHDHSEKQDASAPQTSSPDKTAATPAPRDPAGPPVKKKNLWPMKIFFAIVAVSLLLSTFTGLYMSYKYIRNTRLVTACLVAGIIIPVLLTFF
jgi:hypothetical protein